MALLRRNLPWLIAVLVLLAGVLWLKNRPPEIEVVQASSKTVAEILAVSGRVRGRQESRLAPEVSGTVLKLHVDEGQTVIAGQKVAELDSDRLQAQYSQAAERVRVAEAQLQVARRGPLASELDEVRAEARRGEKVAEAALGSARQRLLEAQRGPRAEQVEQAGAEFSQAQAQSQQSERDWRRQKELLQKGAISKQAYEQARTNLDQARAQEKRAQERLAELRNGTRPEQLEQARQSVRSAQADLSAARTSGGARVQQLLDRPRPEDIALAEAQLGEAQAALSLAKEQLSQATVVAPFDGMVGRRLLQVGDLTGPSAPIFTFASQPALEVRAEIDESERARLKPGQTAKVRANGYPESFEAELKEFAAEIDSIKGTLEVRLWPKQAPNWLLPGQTVDVNIILSPQQDRLLIPLTAVRLGSESSEVFVVQNGRVSARKVEVSTPTKDGYLVLSGVGKGDRVALYPQSLVDGQKVRTELVAD